MGLAAGRSGAILGLVAPESERTIRGATRTPWSGKVSTDRQGQGARVRGRSTTARLAYLGLVWFGGQPGPGVVIDRAGERASRRCCSGDWQARRRGRVAGRTERPGGTFNRPRWGAEHSRGHSRTAVPRGWLLTLSTLGPPLRWWPTFSPAKVPAARPRRTQRRGYLAGVAEPCWWGCAVCSPRSGKRSPGHRGVWSPT